MSQVQSTPRAAAPQNRYRPSAHRVVWGRIRRLFPPHAEALQTGAGALEISWTLTTRPGTERYATPVVVRMERGWIADLEAADEWGRNIMVTRAADTVRVGMFGYEPDHPLPQTRVIVVG